jgi:hypothetical protein
MADERDGALYRRVSGHDEGRRRARVEGSGNGGQEKRSIAPGKRARPRVARKGHCRRFTLNERSSEVNGQADGTTLVVERNRRAGVLRRRRQECAAREGCLDMTRMCSVDMAERNRELQRECEER